MEMLRKCYNCNKVVTIVEKWKCYENVTKMSQNCNNSRNWWIRPPEAGASGGAALPSPT